MITWDDFQKVQMQVGTIVQVDDFPQARNPSYKLLIDFGGSGIKRSSAQITELYQKEELLNRQVIAVTNLPPKQIAPIRSGSPSVWCSALSSTIKRWSCYNRREKSLTGPGSPETLQIRPLALTTSSTLIQHAPPTK